MSYLTDAQLDNGALGRRLDKDPYLIGNSFSPKNLLTRYQSSFEEGDAVGMAGPTGSPSVVLSTDYALHGTKSVLITTTVTTTTRYGTIYTGAYSTPVVAGRTYTGSFAVRLGTGNRQVSADLYWYNAAGSYVANTEGAIRSITSTGWTTIISSGVAPAGAVTVGVLVKLASGSIGDSVYADCFGIWEGAGGKWVYSGERVDPATLGHYTDESAGRRIFEWDYLNSRWQMTYGDTGWRSITPENSWTGTLYVRRQGNICQIITTPVGGASASADTIWTVPSGFRPGGSSTHYITGLNGANPTVTENLGLGTTLAARTTRTAYNFSCNYTYMTSDAWPTSLPGTASGVIPQ
jgi:hypothetical protein